MGQTISLMLFLSPFTFCGGDFVYKKKVNMKTNIGKPRKIKSPEALVKLFEEYLDTCFTANIDENGKEIIENIRPLSLLSFSNFIGINRDTLWDYSKREEYGDTIKKIKEHIEAWIADQLYVNPRTAGLIFILKNGYDWKDKIETENINTNLNTTLNIEFVDDDDDKNENT